MKKVNRIEEISNAAIAAVTITVGNTTIIDESKAVINLMDKQYKLRTIDCWMGSKAPVVTAEDRYLANLEVITAEYYLRHAACIN